jgi:hypothetical protein
LMGTAASLGVQLFGFDQLNKLGLDPYGIYAWELTPNLAYFKLQEMSVETGHREYHPHACLKE